MLKTILDSCVRNLTLVANGDKSYSPIERISFHNLNEGIDIPHRVSRDAWFILSLSPAQSYLSCQLHEANESTEIDSALSYPFFFDRLKE